MEINFSSIMTDTLNADIVTATESPPESKLEFPLPISKVCALLSRRLPHDLLDSKTKGGAKITYIPWYKIPGILDKYCPGWSWEITKVNCTASAIFVTGRLSIPTSDCGIVYREAMGNENLKEMVLDKRTGEMTERDLAYGDPSSNAESMAFRRAAAKFGLALYLYNRK